MMPRHQRGYTYIGLLLLLALAATALSGAGTLWSLETRRDREAELLFVGQQFSAAIKEFRDKTPAGQQPRFPRRLEELLDDKRWPTTRRHLRQVFPDPITGSTEWGILRGPGGEIMGVHSLSEQKPLKRGNFPLGLEEFAYANSYREWRFVYLSTGSQGETN